MEKLQRIKKELENINNIFYTNVSPFKSIIDNLLQENIVIVYGTSDDLIELDGFIIDEIGMYKGGEFIISTKIVEDNNGEGKLKYNIYIVYENKIYGGDNFDGEEVNTTIKKIKNESYHFLHIKYFLQDYNSEYTWKGEIINSSNNIISKKVKLIDFINNSDKKYMEGILIKLENKKYK